ncbi:MAG: 3'-5' exonuclease [Verrucomicrobia bacterium]|nr:3'-5' exonuclease [Verrucomicrobiota bacterium]
MINPFSKKEHPEFIRDYLIAAKQRKSGKRLLSDERIVVLDIETNGRPLESDEILSLALFEIVNGQIELSRQRKWIVYHPDTRPTRATAIHGILPCETEQGVPEPELLKELIPILAGALVVCHHIRFDLSRINKILYRHFKVRFKTQAIDTAILAMHELSAFHKTGYPNQRAPSLDEICAQFNLPATARHTAEGDAFTTAQAFLFLCGRLQRRLGRPIRVRDLPLSEF